MGLGKGLNDNEDDVSLYSEELLEIQISGPDVWHSPSHPDISHARGKC